MDPEVSEQGSLEAEVSGRDSREAEVRDLYLELLIGALTHTIYAGVDRLEPPERI